MDDREIFFKLIQTFNSTMEKTDELNKRLIKTMVIVVFVVSLFFSATFSFFINNYFKTDYGYPDTTISNNNTNTNNNK